MKTYAVIIKHPGRDWEGDVRVDIVKSELSPEEVREKCEREMLGPFRVLFVTEKINFDRKFYLTQNETKNATSI